MRAASACDRRTCTNDDETGTVRGRFPVDLAGGSTYTAVVAGYLTPADEPADEPYDRLLAENARPDDRSGEGEGEGEDHEDDGGDEGDDSDDGGH